MKNQKKSNTFARLEYLLRKFSWLYYIQNEYLELHLMRNEIVISFNIYYISKANSFISKYEIFLVSLISRHNELIEYDRTVISMCETLSRSHSIILVS